MTDFIHETPQPENQKPTPSEKPLSEKEGQKRVYTYIAVLFAAAFILILWSFLSTHRMNQELTDQLKGSEDRVQSTLEENLDLENEVQALREQMAQTEEAFQAAQEQSEAALAEQEAALRAMDCLRKIESAYAAYHYNTAKDLIRAFEADGLWQSLPSASLRKEADGTPANAALADYCAIRDKLFPNGVE